MRSEFLTPYTPYQPEVSQGGLQGDVRVPDCDERADWASDLQRVCVRGPSAVAAAGYVAKLENGPAPVHRLVGVAPHAIETLQTLARGWEMEVEVVGLVDGVTQLACALRRRQRGDRRAAELPRSGRALGADRAGGARGRRPLAICAADPIPLGLLEAPGAQGIDIVVGEGQTLGNRLDFGGPSFGFFAVTDTLVRRVPGRIAGQTHDLDGKLGYVLTLQTREQHIRREKATSNICTSQALNALAGIIYLSWLGRRGLVELAELLVQRNGLRARTPRIDPGCGRFAHGQPVVREFPIRVDGDLDAVIERCLGAGINPGYRLSEDELLVAITEQRTRADIDKLAETIEGALA